MDIDIVVVVGAGAVGIVARGEYIPGGRWGGTMEDDDDEGHHTMAMTTTEMIIPEYIDKVLSFGEGSAVERSRSSSWLIGL